MRGELKIGFDGNPPEFRQKRGSEVRDQKTGEVVREGEMSAQNIAVDRLEWLLAHQRIQTHQHAAGRRLQRDAEQAAQVAYASLSDTLGGSGTNRVSDVRCDAIDRVNDARTHIGSKGWRIIELVALENISLGRAESMMRMGPGGGIGALTTALDTLARHYGLA